MRTTLIDMTSVERPSLLGSGAGHTGTRARGRQLGDNGSGGTVAGFLIGVAGSTVAVALALPHSLLAPLISAVLPVAVLIALAAVQGRTVWAGLGLQRPGLRFWPAALAAPTAVAVVAYGPAIALDLAGREADPGSVPLIAALAGSALGALLALPEEIGWRGFLLPRLQRLTSARQGALLTGLAQAAVHLPLVIWTTTYNADGSRWVVVPVMLVTITAAGVFYAWLRDASGSIWPAVLAHGVGNTLLAVVLAAGSSPDQVAFVAAGSATTAIGMSVVAAICLVRSSSWRRPAPVSTGRPPVYTVRKP